VQGVPLSELIAPARRLAFVGLAKNTGKTETLTCVLRELHESGCSVGVTSVGRDREERDVIDVRIEKPCVELPAWSLVATTGPLLRASAIPHEALMQTEIRTPLGRVVVARLLARGSVEIAGPSAAQDVRAVVDAMLAHGAERVLIDGGADRRAASSPAVSDGLVMSTGAVSGEEIEQVVARTRDAVDLVRLVELSDRSEIGRRIRAIAESHAGNVLVGEPHDEPVPLRPRFGLTGSAYEIGMLLHAHPAARHLILRGAVCEPFLRGLTRAARGRELQLTVSDSTKVFLLRRGYKWFERQGISIRVLAPTRLRALTVNPLAPQSHAFDSRRLRALLEEAIPGVPILDVRDHAHELVGAA
jgi:hypothetical protein